MGYSLTINVGAKRYDFDDVLGHSIGNSGAVQVRETDGSITVLGTFDLLKVNLTEEEKAEFRRQVKAEEDKAAATQAMVEAQAAQNDSGADLVTDEVEEDDADYDEESVSAEEYEELADDAEAVAEDARAIAKEIRESEVKH
jgi:hypothetical protein